MIYRRIGKNSVSTTFYIYSLRKQKRAPLIYIILIRIRIKGTRIRMFFLTGYKQDPDLVSQKKTLILWFST